MIYATKKNNGIYRFHKEDPDEAGYGHYHSEDKIFIPVRSTYTTEELRAIVNKIDELEQK